MTKNGFLYILMKNIVKRLEIQLGTILAKYVLSNKGG